MAADGAQWQLIAVEWKQAWRPGLAALVGGALSYSLYSSISSLFVEPLQRQFGWSRGDIAFVHAFGLVVALAAPLIGRLADRLGVRPVLSVGLILTACCYGLLSQAGGSLTYYYFVYFFFSLFGMSTTGITVTRILTGAFHRTRGTALAIGRAGLALTGAAMPLLLYPVIGRYGITGGFLTLGGFILFVALPLVWFWVPSKAKERSAVPPEARAVPEAWSLLLSRPKIWILTLAAVLNYVPVAALMSQMKPLAVSKGLDEALAVGAVSMFGLAATAGALLSGMLVDRYWAPAVAFAMNMVPAVGCLFLLADQVSLISFYFAALMIGLAQGAEMDIVAYMITRYFGLRSYAAIYGLTVLGISMGAAFGSSMIGHSYDITGSYNIALIAAACSFALASFCYLAMGAYPKTDFRNEANG